MSHPMGTTPQRPLPEIRDLIERSRTKEFAESISLTWAEWRALTVPQRDVLILHYYRAVTEQKARQVLADYRTARETLHDAVRLLHSLQVPQTEIAAISGLSRAGVRKILTIR
jgi:hypothetical protein